MFLIGILIGMFLWQVVCCIVLIATNENEEKTIYISMGVCTIFAFVFGKIIKSMRLKRAKLYDQYVFYSKSDDGTLTTFSKCMHPKTAKKFNVINADEKDTCKDKYFVVFHKDGTNNRSYPDRSLLVNKKYIKGRPDIQKYMKQ